MVIGRRNLSSPSPWDPSLLSAWGAVPRVYNPVPWMDREMPTTVVCTFQWLAKSSDIFFVTLPIAASTSELIRHTGKQRC